MTDGLSEPLALVLSADELTALGLLREAFGVDVTRTYRFWEAIVARLTTGEQTSARCPWDVELDYFGQPIRIEVKFSQEFECVFEVGPRRVFKFASPKGAGKEKPSHVTVLLGIDPNDDVHTWVIPSGAIPKSKSITLISPRTRFYRSRSPVDVTRCPLTQMLPEVLRAWRRHFSHEMRRKKRCVARAAQGDLFDDPRASERRYREAWEAMLFVDDDERGRSC